MKTRILHVFSDVDRSHLIKTLGIAMDREKYDVGFVFIGKQEPLLHEYFSRNGHSSKFLNFHGKKDYLSTIFRLRQIFKRQQPDIVHTHLVEGSMLGLTAARLAGVGNRVHTRHHGVESHVYYPHGVYYDRYNNFLSKRIIAISPVVAEVLIDREGVDPKKVITIPHGFHLEDLVVDRGVTEGLKEKYGLNGCYPVIGSIARFIHWKGVHNTVLAFKEVLAVFPNAKLVLANAVGPYADQVNKLLEENIPKENYVTFEFESEIISLYAAFDVFVHVPVEKDLEAFGMVYIEPLTLKIPSVFTLSGIANDFIRDGRNALVVPYNDPENTAAAITRILQNERLRESIIEAGHSDVLQRFGAERLAGDLDSFYTEILNTD